MHEGFINFNAGTEGPNMIEGRISSGVFVGKDSDLGVALQPWARFQVETKKKFQLAKDVFLVPMQELVFLWR